MPDLVTKTVRICNRRGLHARAAAKFVRIAEGSGSVITVLKDDMSVCGTSIMGLLMLSAGMDSVITIRAEGAGAQTAVENLAQLVLRRFDEAE